jgi:hypothetical protein
MITALSSNIQYVISEERGELGAGSTERGAMRARRVSRRFAAEITRRFPPHVFQSRQRIKTAGSGERWYFTVAGKCCSDRDFNLLCLDRIEWLTKSIDPLLVSV